MGNLLIYALALVVLFLAAYILYEIFAQPVVKITSQQDLSLLTNKYNYKQGEAIQIQGSTNCGSEIEIYADNRLVDRIPVINESYSYRLKADDPGKKTIKVASGSCIKSLVVTVAQVECQEGSKRNCTYSDNSCEGIEICLNGRWGTCTPVGIVCEPGTKIGCTMPDACSFGFKTCNTCGTGYGQCAVSIKN